MSERWISELTRQGAEFSDGRVATFAEDTDAGFSALQNGAVLCDLSHFGLMLAAGDDAATFLHGQFCNDVLSLGEGALQWNGWCSPKGRLLVTFPAWQGKQGIYMLPPRSLQPAIQKRLQMFVTILVWIFHSFFALLNYSHKNQTRMVMMNANIVP